MSSEPRERPREHDDLLTSGEVAEMFGVSARTVDRWEEAGKIQARRTSGGHRRFPASQVREILDRLGREVPATAEA